MIEAIPNYLKLDPRLATGGQPNAAQLTAIAQAGYRTVINLAPSDQKTALTDEGAIVENLGMEYVHIPVVWKQPTISDLEQFFEAMQRQGDRPVFVHCALNMRVSAFVYLYRRLRQGVGEAEASADLRQIWTPNPVWQQFIDQAIAAETRRA